MTLGERIEVRRKAMGIKSQAELARMADVGQSTLNGLIRNPYRWSPYLTKIARALQTTVEYLLGETDDPDEGAVPPQPASRTQLLTAQIVLPSEAALAEAFRALLSISRDMDEDELAHELAKRLPTVLRVSAGALAAPLSAQAPDPREAEEAPHDAQPAPRRAARS